LVLPKVRLDALVALLKISLCPGTIERSGEAAY